jgi:hypothetical protein
MGLAFGSLLLGAGCLNINFWPGVYILENTPPPPGEMSVHAFLGKIWGKYMKKGKRISRKI